MAADGLVMQRAKASKATVLTMVNQNNSAPAR